MLELIREEKCEENRAEVKSLQTLMVENMMFSLLEGA